MPEADAAAVELLERFGALLHGHFELSSGKHSDVYVQKARILEHPEPTMELARRIASWYSDIEAVVAPAAGAVPLGFAVALAAGARSLFAERDAGGAMALRRGFALSPGERTLVVEDVVTTGGSAAEVYGLVQRSGADVLGVAALVDRSAGPLPFPLRALVRLEASVWDAAECPMCARGDPIDSPGSRRIGRSG